MEADENVVFTVNKKQLKAEIDSMIVPLEQKAFEAGRRAGLEEAKAMPREEIILKAAQLSGRTSSDKSNSPAAKSPESLARRANALQLEAQAAGKELSNIEAVKAAYAEAGVPL